ncbi:hypothetical protein [Caproicibacter sp. BJN0012]|uniref:hypothetical protein n=1 Tax=Caproicibacter sp. BJN0012 TaxID=3110227 RepID=UPI002E0DF66C
MLKLVKIIVDRKMLKERLSRVKDGQLIELAIIPSQNDCGDCMPAFLHFAAIHSNGTYEDLESIDESAVEVREKEIA